MVDSVPRTTRESELPDYVAAIWEGLRAGYWKRCERQGAKRLGLFGLGRRVRDYYRHYEEKQEKAAEDRQLLKPELCEPESVKIRRLGCRFSSAMFEDGKKPRGLWHRIVNRLFHVEEYYRYCALVKGLEPLGFEIDSPGDFGQKIHYRNQDSKRLGWYKRLKIEKRSGKLWSDAFVRFFRGELNESKLLDQLETTDRELRSAYERYNSKRSKKQREGSDGIVESMRKVWRAIGYQLGFNAQRAVSGSSKRSVMALWQKKGLPIFSNLDFEASDSPQVSGVSTELSEGSGEEVCASEGSVRSGNVLEEVTVEAEVTEEVSSAPVTVEVAEELESAQVINLDPVVSENSESSVELVEEASSASVSLPIKREWLSLEALWDRYEVFYKKCLDGERSFWSKEYSRDALFLGERLLLELSRERRVLLGQSHPDKHPASEKEAWEGLFLKIKRSLEGLEDGLEETKKCEDEDDYLILRKSWLGLVDQKSGISACWSEQRALSRDFANLRRDIDDVEEKVSNLQEEIRISSEARKKAEEKAQEDMQGLRTSLGGKLEAAQEETNGLRNGLRLSEEKAERARALARKETKGLRASLGGKLKTAQKETKGLRNDLKQAQKKSQRQMAAMIAQLALLARQVQESQNKAKEAPKEAAKAEESSQSGSEASEASSAAEVSRGMSVVGLFSDSATKAAATAPADVAAAPEASEIESESEAKQALSL